MRHEAEEAAVFKLISRDPWDRRRRSITLAACKMQRHEAVRIMGEGHQGRPGRGDAPASGGIKRSWRFMRWTVFQIPSAPPGSEQPSDPASTGQISRIIARGVVVFKL